jgi:hypothetical protein
MSTRSRLLTAQGESLPRGGFRFPATTLLLAALAGLALCAAACSGSAPAAHTDTDDDGGHAMAAKGGDAQAAGEPGKDGYPATPGEDPAYTRPAKRGDSPVWFVDETQQRGVDLVQDNGRSEDKFFVEVLGSGAIFFDADRDGDSDLYVLNQRKILPPVPEPAPYAKFYLNDGTGHFTDATDASGLKDPGYSLGVCGGDVDNDGDIDLYVTHFDGKNVMWRNDDAKFTDITDSAGVPGTPDTTDSSCAFSDVNNDGLLDLYVGNYVDHSIKNNRECTRTLKATGERVREYCTPRHYNPVPDVLYLNKGKNRFEDVSVSNGIAAAKGRSLGIAFSDADHDGDQDLFVACDRTASLFYENDGKGKFKERAAELGIALSMDGNEEAGMGVCWGDYDNDGWPDLVKTNYEAEMKNMYHNEGGLKFKEMNELAGMGTSSWAYLGWGTDFFDANNDGLMELLMVNGHLRKDLDQYRAQTKSGLMGYEQYKLLYEQSPEHKFTSLGSLGGPAMTIKKVGRGAAWADIDGDGDLDMIVTNLHERPDLIINDSPDEGHWLKVRTIGTKSNRDGIGARLVAETGAGSYSREVRSGQSYLSQSDMTVHFGLGAATSVKTLSIVWPSGRKESFENVAADETVTLTEGGGLKSGK